MIANPLHLATGASVAAAAEISTPVNDALGALDPVAKIVLAVLLYLIWRDVNKGGGSPPQTPTQPAGLPK